MVAELLSEMYSYPKKRNKVFDEPVPECEKLNLSKMCIWVRLTGLSKKLVTIAIINEVGLMLFNIIAIIYNFCKNANSPIMTANELKYLM